MRGYEKTVNEFFLSVKHFMRTCPGTGVAAFAKWGPEEVALQVFGLKTTRSNDSTIIRSNDPLILRSNDPMIL